MRGDLTTFEIRAMYGEAFDKCTGCSPLLQETFMAGKEEFMIRTCN